MRRRRAAAAGSTAATESVVSVIVVHPVARAEEGQRGEDGDDRRQHPGERRGVAHAEVAERLLVEVERVEQRRVDRPAGAAGDDEGRREGLERLDRLHHRVEEDHRRQQRQRDLAELPPLRGAVDARGLVHVLRDLAQTGEEDDHRRAELPDREQDQRLERVVGVRDPARALDAESFPEDGLTRPSPAKSWRQSTAIATEPPSSDGR